MERAKRIDLLLDCLHLDAGRVDADRLAALTETDWEALVALATEQKVCAVLTQQLKSRGLDAVVPDATMQVLRDFYLRNAARNLHLCNELQRIVTTLRASDPSPTGESIPVIVLKGLHLATQVYDDTRNVSRPPRSRRSHRLALPGPFAPLSAVCRAGATA